VKTGGTGQGKCFREIIAPNDFENSVLLSLPKYELVEAFFGFFQEAASLLQTFQQ
jgi:hypothetical protein